jgi:hypothetical protein
MHIASDHTFPNLVAANGCVSRELVLQRLTKPAPQRITIDCDGPVLGTSRKAEGTDQGAALPERLQVTKPFFEKHRTANSYVHYVYMRRREPGFHPRTRHMTTADYSKDVERCAVFRSDATLRSPPDWRAPRGIQLVPIWLKRRFLMPYLDKPGGLRYRLETLT